MKRQSRMILRADEIIIAMNGVLLSPSALKIQEHRLYAIVAVNPPKIM